MNKIFFCIQRINGWIRFLLEQSYLSVGPSLNLSFRTFLPPQIPRLCVRSGIYGLNSVYFNVLSNGFKVGNGGPGWRDPNRWLRLHNQAFKGRTNDYSLYFIHECNQETTLTVRKIKQIKVIFFFLGRVRVFFRLTHGLAKLKMVLRWCRHL